MFGLNITDWAKKRYLEGFLRGLAKTLAGVLAGAGYLSADDSDDFAKSFVKIAAPVVLYGGAELLSWYKAKFTEREIEKAISADPIMTTREDVHQLAKDASKTAA